jgi:hypothetical protein
MTEQNFKLESADLSAKIPVKSHKDFRFGFCVTAPGLTAEANTKFRLRLARIAPQLDPGEAWGDNPEVIGLDFSDEAYPGICKYLVTMFQEAGLSVSTMGASTFQKPPHWETSPVATDLPSCLYNMKNLQETIATALEYALKPV